jgi:hypothetical protein
MNTTHEFEEGDYCWYRVADTRDPRDCRIRVWSLLRVEITQLNGQRARIKLLDFPQWRQRRVSLDRLVW